MSRTLSSFRALPQSFTLTDIISKIRGVSNALTQIISFTSTRIYNFLDTINNKAYNNSVAEKPPTSLSPAGEQEFSSESYTNISSSDNDYFTTESYDYPYHKFNITINELLNEIQRIKVTWEGHSTILGNISLHIYNFTSGDWGPILDYNNGTVDFNLDKEYTTDFEDLINDSKMFILVQDQEEWTYKLTNTSSLTPLEDIDAMLDWGDVDSDGTNELVIISGANVYIYNHSVGEWLLESNWVSAEFSSTLYESGLCIGDVDGDNYQELVVRSETGDDIYIYENGSSTIEYTITTGEVEGGIGCGDLDGNGTVEMWYLNSSDIIIREWNGTDFRVALTTTFSNNAASGDLGDYDGDGDLEVAFADGDQVKILNSTYDIETTFSVSIDGQPHISFFNLSNQNSDELIIYDNNGIHVYNWTGSTFVEKINFAADSESSTYNEERFTAGDIDSDGRIELLVKDGNYLKTYTFMIGEVSTDYIEIKVTSSTITVKRIFSSIKILLQTLNLNVVLSRVYSGLRTLTQTLQITDALTQIYNSLRALSQILSITDVLSRLREVPRTLTQALNFNFIISRLTNIYRTMVQQVTVTSILSKVASILKSLLQLLKLTAEVSRIKVHYYDAIQYDPPNITAATSYDVKFNKTIEIDNLGQIRDGFISLSVSLPTGTDLWYIYEGNICSGIVQASGSGTTASWTADALSNTKSNESLCYVYTDGVTGSSLTFTQDTSVISNDTTQFIKATWTVTENVGEDFNISWDLTDLMYSGSTCYANCSNSSYTVTFGFSRIVKGYGDWVTKSEGDRIKVGDAWMNQNVSFTKDNGYTNTFDSSLTINTTATLPSCYVQPSVNLTNSTDHEQTIGGYGSTYIYWNATVPTVGETYTIDFKTPILNVTRNETETVVSWYRYFNMNGTCVDVSNVHVNASIPEDRTAFTLSDNTTGAMTDVTDDPDYNVYFYDLDADGYSDLISWTIPILSADTEEKFVIEGKGVTCSMVSREITNVPLRTMESLIWKETIKCSNSANSSVSYSQKWRMLLGVRDVELDDIAKNLLYDEYGAYIMLTGSLAGGESENRILEYVSDPVTAEARYYYPVDRDEDYVVDEDAYLIINITIHNWSPFDVNETIEKEIPIIYLENVKVYFNDSEIDSEDEILGKYVLEVESIDAGKEKEYQINGTFPTATSTLLIERPEPERGLKVRVYNIKSVTPYVMSELHFIPDIVYNETQEAYRVSYPDLEELEALNWTSKEGNPDFNLGSFAVGIEKYVLIYYGKITPIPDPLEKWIKFLQREVYVPVISVYLARKFAIWELGVVGFSGFLVMVFVYYYWKKKKLGVPFRLKLPKIGRPKIRLPFRHSKKKEKEPEVESEEELF
ncbi:MAG: FG-GAP repeat domain-containing protein [Candidatus Bathyarchaeia archaeon]